MNVMLRPGVPSLATLKEIGVARVSAASGVHKLAMASIKRAVESLRNGDVESLWS